jgi:purine nucleosidase
MPTSSGLLAHSAMFSPVTQTPSQTGGKKKLIYDQDHRGPLSTDTVATLMLLQADNIDLLGICTVTCDMWAKQETAYALRLLEIMGRPEVPVFMGAQGTLAQHQSRGADALPDVWCEVARKRRISGVLRQRCRKP